MSELEDVVSGAANRALQRRLNCGRRITPAKRDAFLGELAESCNVKRSAAAAGIGQQSFYRLRLRDADFAAAWEESLATGYARLEAELMARALREDGGDGADGREPIDRALALAMLTRRDSRARLAGPGAAFGTGGFGRTVRMRHVTMADVEAALARQLARLAKRLDGRA